MTMWTPGMQGVCHDVAGADVVSGAPGGAQRAGAGGTRGRPMGVVAPAQPDDHGTEGEAASDDGSDDAGQQPDAGCMTGTGGSR